MITLMLLFFHRGAIMITFIVLTVGCVCIYLISTSGPSDRR